MALEQDENVIKFVRGTLSQHTQNAKAEASDARRKIAKLERRRGKVIAKTGENMLHRLIDQQLRQQQGRVAHLEKAIEVARDCGFLLDNYESHEEPPVPPPMDLSQFTAMANMMRRGF